MKFRIFDRGRGEWVHDTAHAVSLFGEFIVMGYLLTRPDGTEVRLSELNDLDAMECISLEDCKNTDIFEGDVVGVRKDDGSVEQVPVRDIRGIPKALYGPKANMEIVGNKYDNPELAWHFAETAA